MTTHETISVDLIKSQLDQVCELYKLPKYTALQSRLENYGHVCLPRKLDAERIATLEAQLAEAVGLLEQIANSEMMENASLLDADVIAESIKKAREVMG